MGETYKELRHNHYEAGESKADHGTPIPERSAGEAGPALHAADEADIEGEE